MIKMIPRSPRRRILLVGLIMLFALITIPTLILIPSKVTIHTLALAGLCLWASYTDFITFRIPDSANALIFLTGLVAIATIDHALLIPHAITSAVAFALFWATGEVLFRRFGKDMLGIGDAKLFGAGAAWVGPFGLPSVLLIATLTALLYSVAAKRLTKRVPFGPFLALGIVAIWTHGPIIL